MDVPDFVIVSGPLGSGKTTLGRAIASQLEFLREAANPEKRALEPYNHRSRTLGGTRVLVPSPTNESLSRTGAPSS